jgi:curved DNA-binding protein CbpA
VTDLNGDPFLVLGLPPEADLPDDDVRAAWRRIAAATHPDRDDGGDPARFGAAAAAYAMLRTSWDRGEALADLGFRGGAGSRRTASRPRAGRLVLRAGAAAVVCAGAFAAAGWTPASIGVLAGALTWLAVTGRHDLTMRSSKASSERRKTRTKARGS